MTQLPPQIGPTLYTAKPRGVWEDSASELGYKFALPDIPDTRNVPEGSRDKHKRRRAEMGKYNSQIQSVALARAQALAPNKNAIVPLTQGEIYTAILESLGEVHSGLIDQNSDLRAAGEFVIRLYDNAGKAMGDDPIKGFAPAHGEWIDRLREIINA